MDRDMAVARTALMIVEIDSPVQDLTDVAVARMWFEYLNRHKDLSDDERGEFLRTVAILNERARCIVFPPDPFNPFGEAS
jgi:hypothetical protein